MELTRKMLADALEHQLRRGVRGRSLAAWAHGHYLDHTSLAPGVYEALMRLVALEEGEEFALTEAELTTIVVELRMQR